MPAKLKLLPSVLGRNTDLATKSTSPAEIEGLIQTHVRELLSLAKEDPGEDGTFMAFEKSLFAMVQVLGRLLVVLFLTVHEARLQARMGACIENEGVKYLRKPAQSRGLSTGFGVVRYFRA